MRIVEFVRDVSAVMKVISEEFLKSVWENWISD
jgi:hypothetical protein